MLDIDLAVSIKRLSVAFVPLMLGIILHEVAHGWAALKRGDPTAAMLGRLTLNPIKHIDIVGLIMLVTLHFGWAKPVPVNPGNFKKYRSGCFWTSAAGVIVNYLSAFLFYPLLCVVVSYMPQIPFFYEFLRYLTGFLFAYSLSFFVFNLLPLYPLDGFRILDAALRRKGKVYDFLYRYGQIILLALIAESFLCDIFVRFGVWQMDNFNILGWFMRFATQYLGWPITALWGLIPW